MYIDITVSLLFIFNMYIQNTVQICSSLVLYFNLALKGKE